MQNQTSQLHTLTDEELVERAKGGEQRATEQLLSRHRNLVRGIARRFFLIGGETDDLVQEGMIGLYEAVMEYERGKTSGSFKSFAYLCVRRRIVDVVKSGASKKNAPFAGGEAPPIDEWESSGPSPEDIMIFNDDTSKFYKEMGRVLSDFEFKIVVMYYMEGFTYAEICQTLGKSAKSVDNALQRSKKKLLAMLKK